LKTISIILPVYNEETIIKKFSDELFAVLDGLGDKYLFEVLYCVDKSTDNTKNIVKTICKIRHEAVFIGLTRRFGQQMSLVAGMDRCTGDAAVMMDCDLEHPPSLIPTLLQKYEQGYDVVHTLREYNQKVNWFKKKTSGLFYSMLSLLSTIKLDAGSADYRLISRRCLDVFKSSIREQNQFLRGLFRWVGFNQCTVKFVSGHRSGGRGKYPMRRLLSFAINGIISFSKLPLLASAFTGIIVALLGFIYGIYTIIVGFINKSIPQGWSSTVSLIAFLGGLQLASLGILGRYIGEIFDEVKRRPLYIIEEEYRA
jgi:dolichol-phosphate mannosyltransferase